MAPLDERKGVWKSGRGKGRRTPKGRQLDDAALAEALGREAVFDLIATVGFYSVLGYILMSYDTPIDDRIAEERFFYDPRQMAG